MFTKRTLFICGAGTSQEAGLPIGTELIEKIRTTTDVRYDMAGTAPAGKGDFGLLHDISGHALDRAREFQRAGLKIRDGAGFSSSIDDFLDVHRNDPEVTLYGKAAIAKCILDAEKESQLFVPQNRKFNSDQIRGTWFVKFMHILGRGVPRESALSIFNNVAFVVFNYDRCIEYFLLHALQNLFSISHNEARSALQKLTIIHPYGSIGLVDRAPFGQADMNCADLAGEIKTYTEQIQASGLGPAINAELQRAERIVFLGFAFRGENMRFFAPSQPLQDKNVYGTAYNMSDSDVEIVTSELARLFQNPLSARTLIRLENKLQCTELFDYYAKSLSGD
jgi:hypothetical protein